MSTSRLPAGAADVEGETPFQDPSDRTVRPSNSPRSDSESTQKKIPRKGKGRAPATQRNRILELERLLEESTRNQSESARRQEERSARLEAMIANLASLIPPGNSTTHTPRPSINTSETPSRPLPSIEHTQETDNPRNARWNTAGGRAPATFLSRNTPESYLTPAPQPRKSVLTEKIQPLDAGTDPTFIQWKISVQDRLDVNSDHYQTERSRKALVWSATTGRAKEYLEPRYQSESHGFVTAEEMLNLLSTYFLTGNETNEKRRAFHILRMHDNHSFPEFKAKFISLAIQSRVAESEWFFYCWEKITERLRYASAPVKIFWGDDFNKMVEHLTVLDNERRWTSERTKGKATPPVTTKKTFGAVSSTPADTVNKSSSVRPNFSSSASTPNQFTRATTTVSRVGTPKPGTPAQDQKKPNTPEPLCYRCGLPGHLANRCPQGPSIKEVDLPEEDYETEELEAEDFDPEENREGNVEA